MAGHAHPKHVQFEPDGFFIEPLEQDVDGPLSRLTAKFEAVIVIAELEAGCAALRSGLIHFVRELLEVIEIAALLRPKVRHHHVLDAELLRVFDGLRPG